MARREWPDGVLRLPTGCMVEWSSGRVVEIGFGSGLNLAHYPSTVDMVFAVEPAQVARRLAARRISASSIPVSK